MEDAQRKGSAGRAPSSPVPVLRAGEGCSAPDQAVVNVSAELDWGQVPLGQDEIPVLESWSLV